jgi:hypothetical protein
MNPTAFRQPYKKHQLWRSAGKMVVCRKQGYQEKIYWRAPEIIKYKAGISWFVAEVNLS